MAQSKDERQRKSEHSYWIYHPRRNLQKWPNINVDKERVDIEKPKFDATGMWNPNGRELAPALLIALKQLSPM